MMFIILTLIVAVAAFNIVSTLVMVVNRQTGRPIAILRTLGGAAIIDHENLHGSGRADRGDPERCWA